MLFPSSIRTRAYADIPARLEVSPHPYSNAITSVQKDTLILELYRVPASMSG